LSIVLLRGTIESVKNGTITFDGVDLSLYGTPTLNISRSPDPAPPGVATRQAVTLTVSLALASHDPATIAARMEFLQGVMNTREGILRAESPGGHYLSWLAMPAGDGLASPLTGTSNTLTLQFMAHEPLPDATVESLISATITPVGGSPIILHALDGFQESLATDRVSLLSSARTITTTTLSFRGLYATANQTDNESSRWTYLRTQAEAIKTMNARYATLVTGGVTRVVRIQNLTPVIDPHRTKLEVEVQCFHHDLPGGNDAIVTMKSTTSEDEGSGEITHSYSGTITADDEAVALTRLTALILAKSGTGKRLASLKSDMDRTVGGDTSAEEWTGTLNFSFEYRELSSTPTYFRARLATSQGEDGRKLSVTGEIRGRDEASLIAKARSIGADLATGSPTRMQETTDYLTEVSGNGTRLIVSLSFSYDYPVLATTQIHGSVEWTTSRGAFSDHTRQLSGVLAGPNITLVRNIARSLIPGGVILTTDEEKESWGAAEALTLSITGASIPTANTSLKFAGRDSAGNSRWSHDGHWFSGSMPTTDGSNYLFRDLEGTGDWSYFHHTASNQHEWQSSEVGFDPLPGTGGDWTPDELDLTLSPMFTDSGTLRFSYAWKIATTGPASIEYRDSISVDEGSMTEERTISGTARGADLSAAQTAVAALLASLSPGTISRRTTGSPYQIAGEKLGNLVTQWMAYDFSYTIITAISGSPANDIIEASVSIQRIGAINRPIVHTIPFARPIAQVDTGWTPGRLTIQARCKARQAATARSWVQGKRTLATSIGTSLTRHETEPPDESADIEHLPFSGSTITTRTFSGRYGWTFTNVSAMDGIFPSSMDV